MRARWWLLGLMVPFLSTGRAAGVLSLDATSATVAAPGEIADLCVVLSAGGENVAGTQNDLVWDDSCATLSSADDCRVNTETGKSLHASLVLGHFRALVLSLEDTNPIPDGPLYCCTFSVEATPGSCCAVSVVNTGASTPKGLAIPSVGNTAELCVLGESTGPTPTVAGDPPSDNDGCQLSALPRHGLSLGPFAIAILLAVARRRFR